MFRAVRSERCDRSLKNPFIANKNEAATAIVSGFLSSGDPTIQAIPLATNARSIATEAQVRITHGSPSTPDVDIYLLPAGMSFDPANTDANFPDVPFGADTGILSIDATATYYAYVTAAGGETAAIGVLGFAPEAGAVLDIIARDPQTDGSEGPNPQLPNSATRIRSTNSRRSCAIFSATTRR